MVLNNKKGKGKEKAPAILRAEVPDVRQIATILKTVDIRSETKATVTVQDDGLSFAVEVGQTILARAHLHHTNNFTSYAYHPPPQQKPNRRGGSDDEDEEEERDEDEEPESTHMLFEISLSALLNCINIFGDSTVKPISAKQAAATEKWKRSQRKQRHGSMYGGEDEDGENDAGEERQYTRAASTVSSKKKGTTAMELTWEAEGCPLVLRLVENGIVTHCEITTFDAGEVFELPYQDDERMQRLILQSSWLAEALSEIDSSTERLTLRFAPPRGVAGSYNATQAEDEGDDDELDRSTATQGAGRAAFSLEARGNSGSVQMDYPFTKEVLEVCECERAIRNSYKFSHISYIRSALAYSTKASLRTDSSGILILQFMIGDAVGGEVGAGFVEFTCMPLNDEQDD